MSLTYDYNEMLTTIDLELDPTLDTESPDTRKYWERVPNSAEEAREWAGAYKIALQEEINIKNSKRPGKTTVITDVGPIEVYPDGTVKFPGREPETDDGYTRFTEVDFG